MTENDSNKWEGKILHFFKERPYRQSLNGSANVNARWVCKPVMRKTNITRFHYY